MMSVALWPIRHLTAKRDKRLRSKALSVLFFLIALALVAVPGSATLKFALLVAVLVVGTLGGDFQMRGWVIGALAVLSMGLAYLVALVHQVAGADRDAHLLRIFSFYAAFATLFYIRRAFMTPASIDRLCLYSTLLMAAFKIGILIAVNLFGISLIQALDILGFESVTLMIRENIFRLQFPSDFIVLFLLACYSGRRSAVSDILFVVAVGVVVFLSFSRFIFLCFFVGLFVRMVWTGRADLITGISGVLLLGTVISFGDVLVERFVGEGSDVSDDIRVEQVQQLTRQITVNPVFGSGVGASVPNFTRSESLPYSYEVQWYATLMQFGVIGTAALLLNVTLAVMWRIRGEKSRFCLAVLLAMWVFAGFTNPFITSLGSAVGLSIARRRAQLASP